MNCIRGVHLRCVCLNCSFVPECGLLCWAGACAAEVEGVALEAAAVAPLATVARPEAVSRCRRLRSACISAAL